MPGKAPLSPLQAYGCRHADRAVKFPLVQGADVPSLGTADAIPKGQGADRAEGGEFLFHGIADKGLVK